MGKEEEDDLGTNKEREITDDYFFSLSSVFRLQIQILLMTLKFNPN